MKYLLILSGSILTCIRRTFSEDAEHFDTIETEQLEYDPAKLFATVYRRYKYKQSKPDGSTSFFIASLPKEKDKSLAAPSLKAHVTTEKYMYHMPIYRQMQKFSQHGIILSENTIGDWINGTCPQPYRNLRCVTNKHCSLCIGVHDG